MLADIKERAFERYDDEWVEFKCILLQQIDYFRGGDQDLDVNSFLREIQFYMEEQIYQPGTEIYRVGDHCSSIVFVVNGTVDIEFVDSNQSKYLIDTLK